MVEEQQQSSVVDDHSSLPSPIQSSSPTTTTITDIPWDQQQQQPDNNNNNNNDNNGNNQNPEKVLDDDERQLLDDILANADDTDDDDDDDDEDDDSITNDSQRLTSESDHNNNNHSTKNNNNNNNKDESDDDDDGTDKDGINSSHSSSSGSNTSDTSDEHDNDEKKNNQKKKQKKKKNTTSPNIIVDSLTTQQTKQEPNVSPSSNMTTTITPTITPTATTTATTTTTILTTHNNLVQNQHRNQKGLSNSFNSSHMIHDHFQQKNKDISLRTTATKTTATTTRTRADYNSDNSNNNSGSGSSNSQKQSFVPVNRQSQSFHPSLMSRRVQSTRSNDTPANHNQNQNVSKKNQVDSGGKKDLSKLDSDYIFLEGYLLKEGYRIKSWRNRWFVVKKHLVQYYSKKGGALKGEIQTLGTVIKPCYEKKLKHCFKIETSNDNNRTWYIQIPSVKSSAKSHSHASEYMNKWIQAIVTFGGATYGGDDASGDEKHGQDTSGGEHTRHGSPSNNRVKESSPSAVATRHRNNSTTNSTATSSNSETSDSEKDSDKDEDDSFDSSLSSDSDGPLRRGTKQSKSAARKNRNNKGREHNTSVFSTIDADDYYGGASSVYYDDDDDDDDMLGDGIYRSDDELWDMLQNSRQTVNRTRSNRSKANKAQPSRANTSNQANFFSNVTKNTEDHVSVVSSGSAVAQSTTEDLFNYFASTSEKQQAVRQETHTLPPVLTDGEAQQLRGPRTPFGDISILAKNETKTSKLDVEELKHHMRKQKFINTFSEDMGDEDGSGYESDGTSNQMFVRDLIIDEDEDTASLRTSGSFTSRGSSGKSKGILALFSQNYHHPKLWMRLLVIISGFLFFLAVSIMIFLRADMSFSRKVFTKEETYVVSHIDQAIQPVKFLFGQSISIVTLMETSLSESGAFMYRAIYENTAFKRVSAVGPLLESKAYVGRVLQMGSYTSILFAVIASLVGSALISGLPRGDWMHGFMRTPFFLFEFLSLNFESSLLGILHWWQWLILNVVACGGYFALFFALKATNVTSLLSSSISYESYAFVHFVLCFTAVVFTSRYKTKYDAGSFQQDKYTVSRYLNYSSYILLLNIIPCTIQIMCGIVVKQKLPEFSYDTYSKYMAITTLFTLMGVKMNQSMILSIGTRYVKQLMFRTYIQFMFKCLVMFVVHTGVLVGLFFSLNVERNAYFAGITWGMIISSILLNMYQSFSLNFENYAFISWVSVLANTCITLPAVLVSLLKFSSIRGIFFGFMISNIVQTIVIAVVVHFWDMRDLKIVWLEMSAKRKVNQESASLIDQNE